MEKHQPLGYNLLIRILAKCYPKAKSKIGSVIFQNCLFFSHCNSHLRKNVDLEIWKIQWNLQCVATDCNFQTYRQASTYLHNINQCCSVVFIALCCLYSVEMSLYFFTTIHMFYVFTRGEKNKLIPLIVIVKRLRSSRFHTQCIQIVLILVCDKLFNNKDLSNIHYIFTYEANSL